MVIRTGKSDKSESVNDADRAICWRYCHEGLYHCAWAATLITRHNPVMNSVKWINDLLIHNLLILYRVIFLPTGMSDIRIRVDSISDH